MSAKQGFQPCSDVHAIRQHVNTIEHLYSAFKLRIYPINSGASAFAMHLLMCQFNNVSVHVYTYFNNVQYVSYRFILEYICLSVSYSEHVSSPKDLQCHDFDPGHPWPPI